MKQIICYAAPPPEKNVFVSETALVFQQDNSFSSYLPTAFVSHEIALDAPAAIAPISTKTYGYLKANQFRR